MTYNLLIVVVSAVPEAVQAEGVRFTLLCRQGHPDGHAFLVPDDADAEDLYISRRALRPAMHGDRAAVRIERGARGRHLEGRVTRILEGGKRTIPGGFSQGGRTSSIGPRATSLTLPVARSRRTRPREPGIVNGDRRSDHR